MTGFSAAVRTTIRQRSGGLCEVRAVCNGSPAVHQHHRRNRGAGGSRRADTNTASNGLHACLLCHDHIGAHPCQSYGKGWLVRQTSSPAAIPVLMPHLGGFVYLQDDGSIVHTNGEVVGVNA